jgi:hypothetical protein
MLTESRWWTIAVIATGFVLSALVLLEQDGVTRTVGAIATMAAIVVVWLVVGKRALASPRYAVGITVAFILLASTSVYFEASMATVQCIAYPVIWTVLDRTRTAIIANVCLALGIGTGMYLGLGGGIGALAVAGSIEGLSVVFSIALGLWITSIAEKSEERRHLLEQPSMLPATASAPMPPPRPRYMPR